MSSRPAGRARPLYKVLQGSVDPLRLFSALADGGRAPHACLLESADVHRRNAVRSLGCVEPCLRLEGRAGAWRLDAFRPAGERVLAAVRAGLAPLGLAEETVGDAGFAALAGSLPAPRRHVEERARLSEPGPMDLLRVLKGAFPLEGAGAFPPGGLFGAFAYDFVDCFEALPPAADQDDPLPVPDYVFYLADRLFQIDHFHGRCALAAIVFEDDSDAANADYHAAQEFLRRCEEAAASAPDLPALPPPPRLDPAEVETDLDDAAYESVVEDMKEHILAGDVFQIVPSRSFTAPVREEPLTVYRRLRALNPSPYMFYLRLGDRTLLGASPETALKVTGSVGGECRVEIRPIAGTKPRGLRGGAIDPDLDSRYESELKLDAKELAEHVMLVDLARNDVARVSAPASRLAEQLFVVEKYSHVQHLVSGVAGRLADGLDPLHAYLATMNMGTLTGAPKVEAMRLLRGAERSRRGFYGGAVGYWLLDGEFDTAIVIRSLLLAGDRAVARAGAGIVHDSVPAREAEETANKARAPLAALGYPADAPRPGSQGAHGGPSGRGAAGGDAPAGGEATR